MTTNRSFTGRSIGGVALLPYADRAKPFVVLGSNERGGSAYPLPALELRAEEGGEEGGEAGLVTYSYADHLGGVSALCSGPTASPASSTPAFLLAGSDRGALSVYPVSSPESGAPPVLGDLPQAPVGDSPAAQNGAPVFRGFWSSAAGGWATQQVSAGQSSSGVSCGDGTGDAPVVELACSKDGARVGVLRESGLLTIHALASLSGPALATMPCVDEVDSLGLCWRGDGDRSCFTVGAQHLKLWDVNASKGTRPALHIGDPPSSSSSSSPCSYTSVAVPPGDQDKVACGTSDGRVVLWDLRMPGTAAHAIACKTSHPNPAASACGGGYSGVSCLAFHQSDPTVLFSGGGDDGCMVLNDLSPGGAFFSPDRDDGYGYNDNSGGMGFSGGGRGSVWRTVLAGGRSRAQGGGDTLIPASVVGFAFDPETTFLAAAFDNEALATVHRHPRLGMGGRFM